MTPPNQPQDAPLGRITRAASRNSQEKSVPATVVPPVSPVRQHPRNPARAPMLDMGDGTLVNLRPGTSVQVERSMADICIVFDTTGSMSNKIAGLTGCMSGFVDQLGKVALDWRISVVPFGDLTVPGDAVVTHLPFVRTVDQAKLQLEQMPRFSGGTNLGESAIEGMLGAIRKPWRQGTVKVVVLLTDEPALGKERSQQVLGRLRSEEIVTFVASPRYEYYESWAKRTGGKWFEIGSSMDTRALLTLLRGLVSDVATVAAEVHAIAGGDVRKYLELTTGDRSPERRER